MSKIICGAPWSSANFSPQGFQFCCQHNRQHYPYSTLAAWLDSPELRLFQQRMTAEDYDSICRRCLDGGHNAGYGMYVPHGEPLKPGELWMVNFFMSSHCNIACRTCSPHFSDTQSNFRRKLGLPHQPAVERPYDVIQAVLEVNRRGARHAIIAGGDPVYETLYKQILLFLRKDVQISVVTNGQRYDDEFFQLVAQFDRYRVSFSQDGPTEVNEYMRTFAKTERSYATMREWLERYDTDGTHTGVGITVSNVTVFHLLEFALEIQAQFPECAPNLELTYTVVSHPSYFTPSNLPAHLRQRAAEKIQADLARVSEVGTEGSLLRRSFQEICEQALHLLTLRDFVPAEWTEFLRFNSIHDAALPPGIVLENLLCE